MSAENPENDSGLSAVVEAVRDGAVLQPLTPGDSYHVIEPAESRVVEVATEHLLAAPKRKTGKVLVATVDSLKEYIDRHAELDATVWVHPTEGKITAVLNDHSASAPAGWGDHRASVELIVPEEWDFWAEKDRVLMDQVAFAEHVEEGAGDIVTPAAAEMLEVAQSIQASSSAQFKQAHRLTDGQVGIRYEETLTATAGQQGELAIPTEFTLGLAPFLGEAKYSVKARLRYRIRQGDLSIGYNLDRPQIVVRDALNRIALDLREKNYTVFEGTPRS